MRNLSFFNYIRGEEDDFSEILSGLENQEQKKSIQNFFMMKKVHDYLIRLQNYPIITQQKKNWKF